MYRRGMTVVGVSEREAHYARQRTLFELLVAGIQGCVASGGGLAMQYENDHLRVENTGTHRPALEMAFDEGTASISYQRVGMNGVTSSGKALAGYAETALLVEHDAVARRMGVDEVVSSLLSQPSPRSVLRQVA